jgi:LmbE family N-acetylglucosaminyl deacetylase
MVLAPHPDDEALMCAGIIYNAIQNGDNVFVLIATSGDYDGIDMGLIRINESINAMKTLGVPQENMMFLNYGDNGGMEEYPPQKYSDSMLYQLYHASDENQVFTSHAGNSETYSGIVPSFHKRCYGQESSYTRKNFIGDLHKAISDVMPNEIYTTSRYDVHGDHAYLWKFTVEVINNLHSEHLNFSPKLYEALVHAPCGDKNWPKRNADVQNIKEFSCPLGLEEQTPLRWNDRISLPVPDYMQRLPFSENGFSNLKYKVISRYESQYISNREYLLSYVKKDEIFWQTFSITGCEMVRNE